MKAFLDFDTPAFAAAQMAEGQGLTQALWNVDNALEWALARLNNPPHQIYLTGKNNFRYQIYPEYKANRPKERPEYLEDVKQHLVKEYGAIISDGCEADDLCGVAQCEAAKNGEESIIYSGDKDLDMIPGWHFSPQLNREGRVIREERQYLVSPIEGLRAFYYQMLVGDSTDNVKGAPGIGKVKAAKILDGLTDEKDLYEAIEPYFSCDEEIELNGAVLWIWREMNNVWRIPTFETSKQ